MDPVHAAFAATPRELFLPLRRRSHATDDAPLPIGHGQTNSQPRTVEAMLRLLDVHAGQKVLDVGSGSGWTTALLAHLVGPEGDVLGLELVAPLVSWGRDNLSEVGRPWARIEPATPGRLGSPDHAPYDRILVSADARERPDDLVDQLAPDGVLVVPVRGRMLRIARPRTGAASVTEHGWYRFVPLL